MAGYKVGRITLTAYVKAQRTEITKIEGWDNKTDAIVDAIQALAPDIPTSTIRKVFLREKKKWLNVDEEVFKKLFTEESKRS